MAEVTTRKKMSKQLYEIIQVNFEKTDNYDFRLPVIKETGIDKNLMSAIGRFNDPWFIISKQDYDNLNERIKIGEIVIE